jgi:hypothetical protein
VKFLKLTAWLPFTCSIKHETLKGNSICEQDNWFSPLKVWVAYKAKPILKGPKSGHLTIVAWFVTQVVRGKVVVVAWLKLILRMLRVM